MKKSGLLIGALAFALIFTGCGKKTAETEKQTETETQTEIQTEVQTEAQTETESETEKQTEPVTEKQDSMNSTKTLNGLVLSADGSKIKVQTARGKQLEFAVSGTDIQVSGGITEGTTVKVVYKGIINGTDTSDTNVLMVKDIDEMETPITEGELMTEGAEADPNAGAGTITGELEDLDTNRIVIRGDDGEAYYFTTYGANINLVNGIQKGNYVTVAYSGDIYGPDVVTATSISDVADGEEGALYGPDPEGEYLYINGSMIDCGIGSITLLTDEGETLEFDVKDAEFGYYNGLVYGNYITLECDGKLKGTDTSKLTVLAVYDYKDSTIFQKDTSDDSDSGYYDESDYSDYSDYSDQYYE